MNKKPLNYIKCWTAWAILAFYLKFKQLFVSITDSLVVND